MKNEIENVARGRHLPRVAATTARTVPLLLEFIIVLFSSFATVCSSYAQFSFETIVLSGDIAPDGNGSFSGFFEFLGPALNNAGMVTFRGDLTGTIGGSTDDQGIFLADSLGGLLKIVRKGEIAPDGDGSFSSIIPPVLNGAGQIAFRGFLTGTSGGNADGSGIFLGDGTSGLVRIARAGQPAPDGNGRFSSVSPNSVPALNESGQLAFRGRLTATSGSGSDDEGIFRGDGTGNLVQIARDGQAVPHGNGSISLFGFGFPVMNDAGQVAFSSFFFPSGGGVVDEGIFRSDGAVDLVQIARTGQAVPVGNGSFVDLFAPTMNNAGDVAFLGGLSGTGGGTADNEGIFRGDGTTGLMQIVRKGQAAPDANGSLSNFKFASLNDAGQVAFFSDLTGTSGDFIDNGGIFLGGGTSGLVQIARKGQLAPDGNGSFRSLNLNSSHALNNVGQIVFLSSLRDTNGGAADDRGIFFYDNLLGLTQVAREGEDFLGSTITGLGFTGNFGARGEERSGLNDLGQVAFNFTLADGRSGIAIASLVPEPSALLLATFPAAGMLWWRMRCPE